MPLVEPSTYRCPPWLPSGHVQTILPALFRRVAGGAVPERERLVTPDQDFLDLDWYRPGNGRLAVLLHGLEGSSRAPYIRGMAAALLAANWDVLAWNFRGCSGEINRRARFYHSGETGDLGFVLERVHPAYDRLALLGFSLGGNVTLKSLGEDPARVQPKVKAAVAFSVPCDLAASARRLDELGNRFYTRRFLRSLRSKVREKARRMPGAIDATGVDEIRSFQAFDDRYTAPLHGFRDAADYWSRSSCRQYLPAVRVPALLVNAANDPFLPLGCYPVEEAKASACFSLEIPPAGGHVGFPSAGGTYWAEARAVQFLEQVAG